MLYAVMVEVQTQLAEEIHADDPKSASLLGIAAANRRALAITEKLDDPARAVAVSVYYPDQLARDGYPLPDATPLYRDNL